ncbi:MAG: hypothetical protein ACRD06_00755 [Terriglobia bacterium]
MQARSVLRVCLLLVLLGASGVAGSGPGHFEIVTGELLNKAIPRDVYLEGSAIPVEKRNAVLIKTPAGARALFALIVTAGFASQLQQKYSGMLISEGRLSICGKDARIGSYGFGIRRTPAAGRQQAQLFFYNQAGDQVIACDMKKDLRMREPRPLQVIIESSDSARLYVGRYWVDLGP